MSFLSSIFGGGQSTTPPAAQPFQTDPLVNQTDTELNTFGTNALSGVLPAPYQDLLNTNSPQFQQMLNNSNAQIQGSALSTAAMQGNARSGAAQAGATQAIASNTANLSYQDLLNTQLNQKAILGTGLQSIGAAQQGAVANQGQENSYASNIYDAGLSYSANMAAINQKAASAAGTTIGAGLGVLGGGIGSLLGSLGSAGGAAAAFADTAGTSGLDLTSLLTPLALSVA